MIPMIFRYQSQSLHGTPQVLGVMEVAAGRSAPWELSFDGNDEAALKVRYDARGLKSPVCGMQYSTFQMLQHLTVFSHSFADHETERQWNYKAAVHSMDGQKLLIRSRRRSAVHEQTMTLL